MYGVSIQPAVQTHSSLTERHAWASGSNPCVHALQAKLPARLQPLRFPLVGEFAAQDCLIAERTLESGTPYVMDIDDAEIYRYADWSGSSGLKPRSWCVPTTRSTRSDSVS